MLHDWVTSLAILGETMRFGLIHHLLYYLVDKELRDIDDKHRAQTKIRLDKRLAETTVRNDLYVLFPLFAMQPRITC